MQVMIELINLALPTANREIRFQTNMGPGHHWNIYLPPKLTSYSSIDSVGRFTACAIRKGGFADTAWTFLSKDTHTL